MKLRHVRDGKLSFHGTKSGKSRSIPVAEDLFKEIHAHLETFGEFSFSLSAFRRALDESGIELPKGHTFISIDAGILTLKRLEGIHLCR